MEPQDDPERRIRELEQPLADTARASELGGTQPPGGYTYPSGPSGPSGPSAPSGPSGPSGPYSPPWAAGGPIPPPPPPLSYGGPFPGTSPRPPSGNRVWWILAAVLVIGVVVLVGGIAAFAAHRFSRAGSVSLSPPPSISRGNTLPRTLPRQTPSSPVPSSTGTQTPSAAPGPSTPPPGGNLSVAGINENQTIACNESTVSVSGVSNTVVITGHCTSLTVSGVQNSITVDSVDTIDVSGFNNQVTYHSGSPKISKSGEGNVVQQG
jgi:hypothetical protein